MQKTPAKIKVEVCLDRVGLRGRSVNGSVIKPRFVQTTQAKKRGPRDVTVRDGVVTCVMSAVP